METENIWSKLARRIVAGLEVQPGELVQVVCLNSRLELLGEVALAIELAGATPLVELLSPTYRTSLLSAAPLDYLEAWDKHRRLWMEKIDRRVSIQGDNINRSAIDLERLQAWNKAIHRLTEIEESRGVPNLIVDLPGAKLAESNALTLAALDELVLPALSAEISELQAEIAAALAIAEAGQTLTVRSGTNCELILNRSGRSWLSDDGYIDALDRQRGAVCSNLPAGSIYTTVVEEATSGTIYLPQAATAKEVILRFEQGRVVEIQAAEGATDLEALFDSSSGEARRVSHIGIGLNPYLQRSFGSVIIDEHVYGNLFLALGENRYMGGQNESSLNIDFVIPGATLLVDNRALVADGQLQTRRA